MKEKEEKADINNENEIEAMVPCGGFVFITKPCNHIWGDPFMEGGETWVVVCGICGCRVTLL